MREGARRIGIWVWSIHKNEVRRREWLEKRKIGGGAKVGRRKKEANDAKVLGRRGDKLKTGKGAEGREKR